MDNHYFIYDKDSFFSQGLKTFVLEHTVDKSHAFRCFNDFKSLREAISELGKLAGTRCLLFDVSSLPANRFAAIRELRRMAISHRLRLVVLLPPSNMPLFFALYSLLPGASWLLKTESLSYTGPFLRELGANAESKSCFSHSLVSYTRSCWLSGDTRSIISSYDWWLMEEIFKGKSLTRIAHEVNSDVRRLSYHKRRLMKKLNVKNNVDLVHIFSGMVSSFPALI